MPEPDVQQRAEQRRRSPQAHLVIKCALSLSPGSFHQLHQQMLRCAERLQCGRFAAHWDAVGKSDTVLIPSELTQLSRQVHHNVTRALRARLYSVRYGRAGAHLPGLQPVEQVGALGWEDWLESSLQPETEG